MTAAANPKTPMITLPIRHGIGYQDVERFCQRSSRLTLSQLVEKVSVAEQVQLQETPRRKIFTIHLKLFPHDECMETHHISPSQLSTSLMRLALNLKRDIALEFKKLEADLKGQVAAIGKGSSAREPQEMNEEDEIIEVAGRDDASEIGDGDADAEKRLQRGVEQTTYDEEGDEEGEPNNQHDDENVHESHSPDPGIDSDEVTNEDEIAIKSQAKDSGKRSIGKEIRLAFANALPLVPSSFSFDEHSGLEFQLEASSSSSENSAAGLWLPSMIYKYQNSCSLRSSSDPASGVW